MPEVSRELQWVYSDICGQNYAFQNSPLHTKKIREMNQISLMTFAWRNLMTLPLFNTVFLSNRELKRVLWYEEKKSADVANFHCDVVYTLLLHDCSRSPVHSLLKPGVLRNLHVLFTEKKVWNRVMPWNEQCGRKIVEAFFFVLHIHVETENMDSRE